MQGYYAGTIVIEELVFVVELIHIIPKNAQVRNVSIVSTYKLACLLGIN